MKALDETLRRLVVEAGLVAVNHGLRPQALAIRDALGDLVAQPELLRLIDAAMLIGLGASDSAEQRLVGDASPEAQLLRRLAAPRARQHRAYRPGA